jgi:ketosteroid isomerase-like protein
MPIPSTITVLVAATLSGPANPPGTSTMNPEDVLRTHVETFQVALKARDLETLSSLYSDDYMLVRPDGSVLSKDEVLRDLRMGGLTFESIDLVGARVRVHANAAVLTGESRTVTSRNGKQTTAHVRLVAVYLLAAGRIRLVHFQSVALPN